MSYFSEEVTRALSPTTFMGRMSVGGKGAVINTSAQGRRMQTLTQQTKNSPEVIYSFVQRLMRSYHSLYHEDRRLTTRQQISVPVRVCPANENGDPVGEPYLAVTRDISSGGVGYFTVVKPEANFVTIEMESPEGETLNVMGAVRHSIEWGSFYFVGIRFLANWDAWNDTKSEMVD